MDSSFKHDLKSKKQRAITAYHLGLEKVVLRLELYKRKWRVNSLAEKKSSQGCKILMRCESLIK